MGKIKRQTLKEIVELLKDLKAKVKKGQKMDQQETLIIAGLIGQRIESYEMELALNRPIYWQTDSLKVKKGQGKA